MAVNCANLLPIELCEKVKNSKVFMVGAGGIGCELLKNLVLVGFPYIEIIDLDTIDVSNLNRQFLFRKEHVGKSKAEVAKESALKFNPNTKIIAYQDNIKSDKYDVDFFKKFNVVLNALDNRSARVHVNRMCLAADIPLIESGTAGYLGQTTLIKKNLSECYECTPVSGQKSYPGCTIRNTPSELIHCIVWSKHLFNQLFGEADADEEVSPDTEDPEAAGDAGEAVQKNLDFERVSTRKWAKENDYNNLKVFTKLFHDDIKYLLSMTNLWTERTPPKPLVISELSDTQDNQSNVIPDQRIWSIKECFDKFSNCLKELKERIKDDENLIWDKDDDIAMDFVTSAACIRAHIFGIQRKSRFDIKSMAGNIIPAIASTNAIIAGLVVLQALKVVQGRAKDCRHIYMNLMPNPRNKLPVSGYLCEPNPKCYVCSKSSIAVRLAPENITLRFFQDKILKSSLGMVAPDVELDDGKGTIVISSEEGETTENMDKTLSEFSIKNGSQLKCDDFLQRYEVTIVIAEASKEDLPEDQEFEVVGDIEQLKSKKDDVQNENGKNGKNEKDDTDFLEVISDEEMEVSEPKKRKAEDDNEVPSGKRLKTDAIEIE
ncbi:DgyrCDS291 [Dimorphilus gyrociliatus]|uniref:SUMO-activating enzyme subunit n=1 Tax=Dimorphilus gyrociliatus TaxID=2664684 RepID=A0A7I8V440_9ANNE|nr:DgyrCDS291 [Dimorphilus gyrociliatus]